MLSTSIWYRLLVVDVFCSSSCDISGLLWLWNCICLLLRTSVSSLHPESWTFSNDLQHFSSTRLGIGSILRQDISFFDQDDNSVGSLTATLSSSASDLAGINGATLGAILNFITTIISAAILSCIIGWKLGLVCTSAVPILLLGGYSWMTVFTKFQARASITYELLSHVVERSSSIVSLSKSLRI